MPCTNCGACCVFLLFNTDIKIDTAWLEARHGRLDSSSRAVLFPNVCKNYDEKTKKCKIYENRPVSCRNFKPYSRECIICRKSIGLNGFTGQTQL